jgi:hypothetical protein
VTNLSCQQERSFISAKVIQRLKLMKHADKSSIRLTWKEHGEEAEDMDKTLSTRFYIIADDKIKCDIALGTGWDDPDPDGADAAGREDEPLLDDADVEETNSSVDAEMPLQSQEYGLGMHGSPMRWCAMLIARV